MDNNVDNVIIKDFACLYAFIYGSIGNNKKNKASTKMKNVVQ